MTSTNLKSEPLTSVGIIGCGWLGGALARQLKDQGISVLATRSTIEHVVDLKTQGVDADVLSLPCEQEVLNKHLVFNQQCIVIAITPQFRHGRVDYAEKIRQIINSTKLNSKVKKVILLSSTAVYNGLFGKVDETAQLNFAADKVNLLNEAEQTVLTFNRLTSQPNDNVSNNKSAYVLRLSGLVGPNRHPGKFLLNGRMLKSPEATVNLIHQQDAVGLIIALLKQTAQSDLNNHIFNGVSATQVTKKEYYQTAAKALGLPSPTFEKTDELTYDNRTEQSIDKIVSGKKARDILHYRFVYDDLLTWLTK
ncbi:SDR family NAD(P)-dependent oxidoreductase [Colwellia sp. E2M01]|uniref:SDR family NAD(P)-dependent oxidoreductase n=1 Tax=Colwellia sp. E2M01 TaxID=2841561 RepID=UPI001C0A4735|nr:SDR family NAD(P)-dependent oxidoreductase [Colwellia sp. E2M01]MBU2871226.1 SDR family NAD(P)-dependent oxidoreductase [Colwellia sp. E2M01]